MNSEARAFEPKFLIMKITAIIVTYSNRSSYVKQVVERLLSFNLHSIIIVNNNSVKESFESLKSLSEKHSIIKLINLDRNTGSAYAFNRGIEKVIDDPESEFIWLLDDDNLPDPDALVKLEKSWNIINNSKEINCIIASYRIDRSMFKKAVMSGNTDELLGKSNFFRSFHYKNYLLNKNKNDLFKQFENILISVPVIPYGGMFLNKKLISVTGLLDESFILYSDDYEFCCRLVKTGGELFLNTESIIRDIEVSWNMDKRFYHIALNDNFIKTYYSLRNRVFLERKYLVTSWPIYILNMIIYSSIVTLLALSALKFKNIKVYYTALYHGLSGKMGFNDKFTL